MKVKVELEIQSTDKTIDDVKGNIEEMLRDELDYNWLEDFNTIKVTEIKD